jgi:Holliday junction resolvase RusA-like endonuclease
MNNGETTRFEVFIPLERIPTVTAFDKAVDKNGKLYDPPELKAARKLYRERLLSVRPPDFPAIFGPIQLLVRFVYPVGKRKTTGAGRWRTGRPDTDALVGVLKDVMTKLRFWGDDAQVCQELVEKFYGKVPGIYIKISVLET